MAAVEVAHADEGYSTNAGTPKHGPVLTMMSKRLRALKKKYNRILQIEESKGQGKVINREQEEVLKTKTAIAVLIDEYEKLRQPLLAAVQEELVEKERELMSASIGSRQLNENGTENEEESDDREGIRKEVVSANVNLIQGDPEHTANGFSNDAHCEPEELVVDGQYQIDNFRQDADKASLPNDTQKESVTSGYGERTSDIGGLSEAQAADLLNLMYFARLFDVGPDGVPSSIWTKIHERNSCLSYDFVFDDATNPLTERDLDALSFFGALLTSRPPNATLSHKDALQQCILHAQLWLLNSDIRIHPDLNTSYVGLRERLNRILLSEYFTMVPELQTATQETAEAAAATSTAANQSLSNILISDAMVGTPVSEADATVGTLVSGVEDPSVQEIYQVSSQQPYIEGEHVSAVPLSSATAVPLADSSFTIKPASTLENSSAAVNALQHTNELEDDQTALGQHSVSEQEAHHSPVSRQRQQHNPSHYGGATNGGYQGARGSGRGYGYGMGGRARGYANGRTNRGGQGYPYGRGGQFHDQGSYYPRNHYGGRSGRGGRADISNGHMNGTYKTVGSGEA